LVEKVLDEKYPQGYNSVGGIEKKGNFNKVPIFVLSTFASVWAFDLD
jgi:hypothetical protein